MQAFHLLTLKIMHVLSVLSHALIPLYIDARLYNWTTFGKTLDWSPIVACSPLITPTTNFSVTVTLPSANGTERHTFITNETRIELQEIGVSLPHDEEIGVLLQILEDEAGKASSLQDT